MTTRLILHSTVSLKGLQAPLVVGLTILQGIASNLGIPELTLTSVTDGVHTRGSLHYVGAACDIRSKDLSPEHKKVLLSAMAVACGMQFDFILEDQGLPNEHFHLEHDEHR